MTLPAGLHWVTCRTSPRRWWPLGPAPVPGRPPPNRRPQRPGSPGGRRPGAAAAPGRGRPCPGPLTRQAAGPLSLPVGPLPVGPLRPTTWRRQPPCESPRPPQHGDTAHRALSPPRAASTRWETGPRVIQALLFPRLAVKAGWPAG